MTDRIWDNYCKACNATQSLHIPTTKDWYIFGEQQVSTGNDYNETIMQTLNIKAHNTEIGAMLNKYFPHGLQYIEKRAKHMPGSIPASPSKEYSPPILTPIPEGWKPRLTTAKARQGMVKKNKAGNLRGIGQNRLALLRLRMK
jgi:hypothetical protein